MNQFPWTWKKQYFKSTRIVSQCNVKDKLRQIIWLFICRTLQPLSKPKKKWNCSEKETEKNHTHTKTHNEHTLSIQRAHWINIYVTTKTHYHISSMLKIFTVVGSFFYVIHELILIKHTHNYHNDNRLWKKTSCASSQTALWFLIASVTNSKFHQYFIPHFNLILFFVSFYRSKASV